MLGEHRSVRLSTDERRSAADNIGERRRIDRGLPPTATEARKDARDRVVSVPDFGSVAMCVDGSLSPH